MGVPFELLSEAPRLPRPVRCPRAQRTLLVALFRSCVPYLPPSTSPQFCAPRLALASLTLTLAVPLPRAGRHNRSAIRSATRRALAIIVSAGFTAPDDGKKLPSTTYRLSRSWVLQFTSSAEVFGS